MIRFAGRLLYLTEDLELIKRQIEGEDLPFDPERKLIDNISTDEITPAWTCFNYDEQLGDFVYLGLRGNPIKQEDIKRNNFSVVVSGKSKGCGSSREHSPYAEKYAGIRLVVAQSIEKIYLQNCQNIGLLTTTDFSILERIHRGEAVPLEEFLKGLDPVTADIVRNGGLFNYNEQRLQSVIQIPAVETERRPMNLLEKIIAKHVVVNLAEGRIGVPYVSPGDAVFLRADVRFSHEYVTAMAERLFKAKFGQESRVVEPQSVYAFRDHLTFLGQVMPQKQKESGLLTQAERLASRQEEFCREQGIRLYGEVPEGGSEAICHNAVLEDLAYPGQVVVGSDSHTCTAGALGCFAFGIGTTDLANSWLTRDVRVRVPQTVKFVVSGPKREGVTAKDIMLYILATPFFKEGRGIGKVLEFAGDGIQALPLDEKATLTNMAVEAGAFTGIIEPDEVTMQYLVKMRGVPRKQVEEMCLYGDPDAEYEEVFEIDLPRVEPMVALPGDPRNGLPLSEFKEEVKIDIAYGGSCTGGKQEDMDMYARVLRRALEEGKRVHPDVQLFIQFGSQKIRQYAEEQGYIEIFQKAGALLVNPSCGACIRAGPGVSLTPDQVTVSAINRNFPGRSGPGKVYLASPLTVAASAIEGKIVEFDPKSKKRVAA